jgi:hypothetical protein
MGMFRVVSESALCEGEWPDSRLGCFATRKRAPLTHWIGGKIGPIAGLVAVQKRDISALLNLHVCAILILNLSHLKRYRPTNIWTLNYPSLIKDPLIVQQLILWGSYYHVLGVAWRIITGSRLDDWNHWHFFTITTNYDSSQSMAVWDSLHSLLDRECLPFRCDEWRRTNHCSHTELLNDVRLTDLHEESRTDQNLSNSLMNSLLHLPRGPSMSPYRTDNCPLFCCLLSLQCLCQYSLPRKQVLASRCIAN